MRGSDGLGSRDRHTMCSAGQQSLGSSSQVYIQGSSLACCVAFSSLLPFSFSSSYSSHCLLLTVHLTAYDILVCLTSDSSFTSPSTVRSPCQSYDENVQLKQLRTSFLFDISFLLVFRPSLTLTLFCPFMRSGTEVCRISVRHGLVFTVLSVMMLARKVY